VKFLFDSNVHFMSFDITNMYTNIPTDKLVDIIDPLCEKHVINEKLRHKITKVSKPII